MHTAQAHRTLPRGVVGGRAETIGVRALGPGFATLCRTFGRASMRRAVDGRVSRSGSARPEHAVDQTIALDDDNRCVGCRAATGVVIECVDREAP